jgi:hypothetical protein
MRMRLLNRGVNVTFEPESLDLTLGDVPDPHRTNLRRTFLGLQTVHSTFVHSTRQVTCLIGSVADQAGPCQVDVVIAQKPGFMKGLKNRADFPSSNAFSEIMQQSEFRIERFSDACSDFRATWYLFL